MEGCRQILLCLRARHGFSKPPKGHIEEFLYDLITDDSLLCFDGSPYEFAGAGSLFWSTLVKRTDENIVSRKNLSLIHLIARETSPRPDML